MDRRVALVTGGCSGLGKATAQRLADEGWRVVVGDISAPEVASGDVSGDAGITAIHLDVSKEDETRAVVDETVARLGRLDLLVNNVGINRVAPLEDLTSRDWHQVLDVDLHGAFYCLQAGHMLAAGGGAIVNIISVAAAVE